jgi:hypothetical protein
MNNKGMNPFLPSYEYIPDGEPHVFDGRVYLYGSHDKFNGYEFCMLDYVCYSAPVDDLTDWRYEGVIYGRKDDPRNADGDMCLYAPDVAQGPDGKYYLYYCLDHLQCVSVAVCDTPAGRYRFLGYVKDKDGGILGEREGDEPQFDPGVLFENGKLYLYTGSCFEMLPDRHGAMVTVLEEDMLTIAEEPRIIAPSKPYAEGSGYEGHEFFEASSMRKIKDTYYFIYSSVQGHELCYATSKSPVEGFQYRGCIISNTDRGIDSYKDAEIDMAYPDNNHGSIECINGGYYVFYHRHTNATSYSRQACMEPIRILDDGSIPQAEMTTSGPNGAPLSGHGYYSAHKACNIHFEPENPLGAQMPGTRKDPRLPYFTQDEPDGVECEGHVANLQSGAFVGFKYFDCRQSYVSGVTVRGFSVMGEMQIRLEPDGEVIGSIPLGITNEWKRYSGHVEIPDGVQALYFFYKGYGAISFAGFELAQE